MLSLYIELITIHEVTVTLVLETAWIAAAAVLWRWRTMVCLVAANGQKSWPGLRVRGVFRFSQFLLGRSDRTEDTYDTQQMLDGNHYPFQDDRF